MDGIKPASGLRADIMRIKYYPFLSDKNQPPHQWGGQPPPSFALYNKRGLGSRSLLNLLNAGLR
jgi:hypothetical protein